MNIDAKNVNKILANQIQQHNRSTKEGSSATCDNMDEPEGSMLSQISKTGNDRYCMISLMWNIEMSNS